MNARPKIDVVARDVSEDVYIVRVDGRAAGLVYANVREMTGTIAHMFSQDCLKHAGSSADAIRRRLQAEMDAGRSSCPIEAVVEDSQGVPVIEVTVPGDWEQGLHLTPYSLHLLREALDAIGGEG